MHSKAKRNDIIFEFLRTILAILISMLLVVIIVLFVSDEPFQVLHMLFLGPFSSLRKMGNIIEFAIPLTFCGLALSLTFRAKQFNMITDGAFYLGAMSATIVAIKFEAPAIIVILTALLAGMLTGAVLGSIPTFLKIKTGASELVTSLMLNHVASYLVMFFVIHFVRDASKMTLESLPLQEGVRLAKILPGTRIHFGLFIVIFVVICLSIFMFKTRFGYALRMTGSNPRFANYSGMSVTKIIAGAQIVGASIAGLGGATEILGIYTSFKWIASPGYGFDGVIIATLARNNPILVPFAALFLSYIRTGADILNRSGKLPYEIISVVQATIILLIASQGFLKNLKQRSLEKQTMKEKGGTLS